MLNYKIGKKVPLIRQTEIAECGLACLGMISSFHGNIVDMQFLREHYSSGLKGLSLDDLSNIANDMGMASRGLKCDIDRLNELALPVIIHWDLNHFVVLTEVSKNHFKINDPARGEVNVSFKEFNENYTGVLLELTPTENFNKIDNRKPLSLRMLWGGLQFFKRNLLKIFALSAIIQAIIMLMPYYMKIIIDEVIISYDSELLLLLAVSFGFLAAFDLFSRILRGWLIIRLSSSFAVQAGINVVSHLMKLPMSYFENRHLGDINSRVGSLASIRDALSTGLVEAIVDGLMSIIVVFVLFSYSILLGSIVLGVAIVYFFFRAGLYSLFKKESEVQLIKGAEEQSHFIETMRGMQTVKLFSHESKRLRIWQHKFVDLINAEIKIGRLNLSFDIINRGLFGVENVVIIFLAAHMVLDGELTLGAMIAFMAYKRTFSDSISRFIENAIQLKVLSLHLERLSDIVMTKKENNLVGKGISSIPDNEMDITLEDVSFRYDTTQPYVLKNISLTIKSGESVVFTGPSGCGKTTLIKIMLGLLKPTSGRILFGGEDICNIGLSDYRKKVASVMQDDALFSGSLADNIAFFDGNLDRKKLDMATYRAAIYNEIQAMPMGYETFVGDMGSTLSGGQKQRILIARALYKNAPVIFMDEATSHLDDTNSQKINSYLKELKITRIAVAHRAETIKNAEREIKLGLNASYEISIKT